MPPRLPREQTEGSIRLSRSTRGRAVPFSPQAARPSHLRISGFLHPGDAKSAAYRSAEGDSPIFYFHFSIFPCLLATPQSPSLLFLCFQQLPTVAVCKSFPLFRLQQWGGGRGVRPPWHLKYHLNSQRVSAPRQHKTVLPFSNFDFPVSDLRWPRGGSSNSQFSLFHFPAAVVPLRVGRGDGILRGQVA